MPDNPLDLLKMLTGDAAFLRHNYLAHATGSRVSINIGGNADVMLTEIEAAHYQITFTGVITADVAVRVPQKEKPYIFVNFTTGEFKVTVEPVTSGTGLELARNMFLPINCDGTDMKRHGAGNARVPEGLFHTIETDGERNTHVQDTFWSDVKGSRVLGRHARGTQQVPGSLVSQDRGMSVTGQGWGRNAADTADTWVSLGTIRIAVDSVDGDGRFGGQVEILTSPGGSALEEVRFLFNELGELVLGNPAGSNNKIRLATADRDGTAGKHSLNIITEDGTEHLLGDVARFTRLANGQSLDFGVLTEVTTIDAAAFTDTTFEIPATAVVLGVSIRVTVAIPTATTFDYGIAGVTMRFGSNISVTAGAVYDGGDDLPRRYPTATKIRIRPSTEPASNVGRVRVTCHYYMIIPPSS